MRYHQLLFSLAIVPRKNNAGTAAFQTMGRALPRASCINKKSSMSSSSSSSSSCGPLLLHMAQEEEQRRSHGNRQVLEKLTTNTKRAAKRMGVRARAAPISISRITTSQLSALTELKKDDHKQRRQRLLRMCIATTASFLATMTKSTVAHAAAAATPLWVRSGGGGSSSAIVTPLLLSFPGQGMVDTAAAASAAAIAMPGGSSLAIASNPRPGAWFFALSLFVATALLRSARGGHARLMHLMARYLGSTMLGSRQDAEADNFDLGLPKESDWGTYSHEVLDHHSTQKKREEEEEIRYDFVPHTMLFEPRTSKLQAAEQHEAELAKLEKAEKAFLEQKYKQHHHPVHATRSKYEEISYLDSLPINNEEERHDNDVPIKYLDTLSSAKASTWDAYKHTLLMSEARKKKMSSEVDELKEEVSNLQDLIQMEQSMYRTSNSALKLAVDAHQTEEERHRSSDMEELKDFDRKLDTNDELAEFDRKAREYEEDITAGVREVKMSKKKKPLEEEKSGIV